MLFAPGSKLTGMWLKMFPIKLYSFFNNSRINPPNTNLLPFRGGQVTILYLRFLGEFGDLESFPALGIFSLVLFNNSPSTPAVTSITGLGSVFTASFVSSATPSWPIACASLAPIFPFVSMFGLLEVPSLKLNN